MSKQRIKVRFNLSRGENYMKWKVTYPDKRVEFFSPTEVQLVMNKCHLKNHRKVAQKIFDGGEKVVCAWVLCEEIKVLTHGFNQTDLNPDAKLVKYNPRVKPNWVMGDTVVDDVKFNRIESVDFGLYAFYF